MKSDSPSSPPRRSVQLVREVCEDVALRLLEPTLSHAAREHGAALLHQQAVTLARDGASARVERGEGYRVTAELIHTLALCGDRGTRHPVRVVRIGGAFPLPWGFRDDGGAIEEVARLLFEDALRSVTSGFITVSVGYDVLKTTLLVSIVDTRSATRGRRRCAAFARGQRSSDGAADTHSPAAFLRFVAHRIERLGGRIEMGVSPLGYSLTDLAIPITPLGPLLHGEEDVGRDARIPLPAMVMRAQGRALLIDRSVSTLRSLGLILRIHGIDTISAPHARLAGEVLRAVPCDSIWIDIEDPIVVRGEVRACLEHSGFSRELVGLSAHRVADRGAGVAAARFDMIVAKPISCRQVQECISRLRGHRSETLERHDERIDSTKRDGGGELRGVIVEYVSNLPQLLSELDRALGGFDFAMAERVAHTLKAGAVFGFREVSTSARTLESALRARDAGAIREARDALARVVARLRSATVDGVSADRGA